MGVAVGGELHRRSSTMEAQLGRAGLVDALRAAWSGCDHMKARTFLRKSRHRSNWRACSPTANGFVQRFQADLVGGSKRPKMLKPLKMSTVRLVEGLMTVPYVCLGRRGDALGPIYG